LQPGPVVLVDMPTFVDEYDPAKPNDYDLLKEKAEEERKLRERELGDPDYKRRRTDEEALEERRLRGACRADSVASRPRPC